MPVQSAGCAGLNWVNAQHNMPSWHHSPAVKWPSTVVHLRVAHTARTGRGLAPPGRCSLPHRHDATMRNTFPGWTWA
eukprot:350499-Chlamydomonas_euryale.AAC.13